MALADTAKVLGSNDSYKVSSLVKRYTLRDTGFLVTKAGNFQLERSLDPSSPLTAANKLRVVVSKDMKKLSMSVTTANGLRAVDIFKSPKTADAVEQYQYVVDDLIDRNVLEHA
ncbi:DUF1831 domain-containing protein [Lacticaseibacillus zhaodongensis]|uniref:DUF1831 domain-containing protein n=1 Tax=Lacticaseibacillus zhaodongensis TaxID=2668065 RepID=UPI0012D3158E|nr:DUF1831 domain-containing protein [Lacticaseibacillus zhaodongensis]